MKQQHIYPAATGCPIQSEATLLQSYSQPVALWCFFCPDFWTEESNGL